ncbi:hypothetical protein QBC40DRAFT_175764 [Triangularia verruculosa]|uniref:F-box domain-containing protein n=1 Tax=Triangularia verruculosa TaxID=2587418 RepID=A0AAN6XGF3_9PEZI|nr:hypothetical protein QBC40DRAFT_175764 [Triangularia verruculosa]
MAVSEKAAKPQQGVQPNTTAPSQAPSQKSSSCSPVDTPTVKKKPIPIKIQQSQSTAIQQRHPEIDAPQVPAKATLQDTRDPLVIAKFHNRDYSPLYRIPEELILCIIEYFDPTVSADLAALFCMAQVCEPLRRCVRGKWFLEEALDGMESAKNMVKYFLRQDLLCARCLPRSDLRMTRAGEVVPRHPYDKPIWSGCKFEGHRVKGIGPLYCSGCDTIHPHRSFSATERQKKGSERLCIGREGKLRLCEHKTVKWIDIEQHVVDLHSSGIRRDEPRAVPIITCDHPQHRTCLSGSYSVIKKHSETISNYHVLTLKKCGLPAATDPNRRCLITQYSQDTILGSVGQIRRRFGKDGKARIKPPHEWLHSLDPDSYQLDDDTRKFGNIWPNCKDTSCWMHYHTYQTDCCIDLKGLPKLV